ncbi:MAG: 23S rRNA (uracil(1939)-C(5))-methyltransferase RlmD, partial [Lachnospiraceae bacterium]|nr:23S rRNA (uracil(1939)-C(5))-methyltransferase RlmD [Lachnospiraceae bacterium]
MLVKNQEIELNITTLGAEGEGIGHYEDGMTVFVSDALPGDKVLAHIMKVKKNYAYAFAKEILVPSEKRVESKCPVAKKCGGCTFLHLDYKEQLKFKQDKVLNAITRIGGIENPPMEDIVGADNCFFYRNKAQFPVGTDKDGNPVIGFYRKRSHDVVANTECVIQADINAGIMGTIEGFLKEFKISAYNEETGKGLVRHVFTRTGFSTGEVMVCIVINGDELPKWEILCERLKSVCKGAFLELKSFCLNINKKNTNVIMGQQCMSLFGPLYIEDCIGDVRYRISPLSFYQVNPEQTKKLYDLALEYADLSGNETVWDLYCGIGTISLYLAKKASKVYGVEIVPEAIENAKENAEINNITNAEFFVGASEDVAPKLPAPDVIVVDPPRKGCDEKLLETIISVKPEKVVYVSCDPATLARDLKILCANGYTLKRVRPVDQFCHTTHVETIALLSRETYRPKKDYIKVGIDAEEYYAIK